MEGVGWIMSIILGALAGWIAEKIMRSNMGLLMNIILGIVGALVANFILVAIMGDTLQGWIGQLIVAVIGACLLVAPGARAVLRPVARLGRDALTASIAHLLLGAMVVWHWQTRARPSLTDQILLVVVVLGVLLAVRDAWLRRWGRGPLEWALRALTT